MAFKVFVFLCTVSVALAGFLPYYAQPTIVKTILTAPAQEAPANYGFNYDVSDHHTGDVHSQQESAKNGAVSGSYQLNDADGFRRTVDYTADDVNGFRANVRREPLVAAPTIIKKFIAQPVLTKIIAAAPAHYYEAAYPW